MPAGKHPKFQPKPRRESLTAYGPFPQSIPFHFTPELLRPFETGEAGYQTLFFVTFLSSKRTLLRGIAVRLLPPFLTLVTVALLGAQFLEIASKNEILSLTSFIVLLSFSALSFNWCRVSPSFAPEKTLKAIYGAGVDFFIASLLALIATFFAWGQTMNLTVLPALAYPILFVLHFAFLLLSLLLFLSASLEIVTAIRNSHPGDQSGGVNT